MLEWHLSTADMEPRTSPFLQEYVGKNPKFGAYSHSKGILPLQAPTKQSRQPALQPSSGLRLRVQMC